MNERDGERIGFSVTFMCNVVSFSCYSSEIFVVIESLYEDSLYEEAMTHTIIHNSLI